MSTLGAEESGEGIVPEPEMYQRVRQRGAVAELASRSPFSTRAPAYVVSFA